MSVLLHVIVKSFLDDSYCTSFKVVNFYISCYIFGLEIVQKSASFNGLMEESAKLQLNGQLYYAMSFWINISDGSSVRYIFIIYQKKFSCHFVIKEKFNSKFSRF